MVFTYVVTYFLVTIVCAFAAGSLLVLVSADMGTEQEVLAFRSYLVCYLLFTLSNAVWIWVNYGYLDISGAPLSIVNLISICVASYFWFRYIELRLNAQRVATTAFGVVSLLPLATAVLFIITTPFTGMVFQYTDANEYIHGPLYSTMAVLALLYMAVATIDLVRHLLRSKSPLQRRQYVVLILFLVFPAIGSVIDIFIPNLPVMELMLLLSTFVVYINMQQSQIYSDVLTGLNNRRLADEYLAERIALATPDAPLYFFICDIDGFKQINDTYGHIEGDRALRIVAQALKRVAANVRCHLARWGGDEFVIITNDHAIDSPETLIALVNDKIAGCMREHMLEYELALSVGWARCTDPSTRATDILKGADERMYDAKRIAHAKAAAG